LIHKHATRRHASGREVQRRLALLVLLLPPSLLLLEEGFSRMMALRREERVCQLLAAVLEYTTFVHTEMLYSILSIL
jgi:ABC-type uncharacterized transport system YnjBCD ATPase subunit